MKNILLTALHTWILSLIVTACFAQNDIGITLNVAPPYSPRITEYVETPGKFMLMVRNNTNTTKSIYLQGSIIGDNGVELSNDATAKPSKPVVLQPFQVYTANPSYLQEVFSVSKYKMVGVNLADLVYKNGLPEGNYEICVRAYDYNTGQPLSGAAPQGCKLLPIANLEPPYPIKPFADEELKPMEPQNMVFTWTIPAGAEPGTQYKLRVIEMLNPAKNINDAYNSGTTPPFYEVTVNTNVFVYGPAQPKLTPGRKYAWAVTAIPGPKKIAYKNNGRSEVRAFIYKQQEPKPTITLKYPADNASFPPIAGISQNAFTFTWDFTFPNAKNAVYENVEMYEVKDGQTVDQAIKQNENCISTKEPTGSQYFNYTCGKSPDGKRFAWFVTLNDNGKIYKSEVRTFTVGTNEIAGQKFTEFDLCGFPVKVTSLTEKGGYVYSGTGTTRLGKDGKEINITFWGTTIQPFAVETDPKTKKPVFKQWTAVKYNYQYPIATSFYYATHINYNVPANVGGSLWFDAKKITFTPNLVTEFNTTKQTFSLKETGNGHGAQLNGIFNWETDMIKFRQDKQQEALVFKGAGDNKFDYLTGFGTDVTKYLTHVDEKGTPTSTCWLKEDGKIFLTLTPKLFIKNSKEVKFDFSGTYTIKNPKNYKPNLVVPITGDKLIAKLKLATEYKTTLTDDASTTCSFDSVNLDLVNSQFNVKIPKLKIVVTHGNTTFPFAFYKSFFSASDGLYCKEDGISDNDLTISGFPVNINKSKITLVKTELAQLYFTGALSIPFLNQDAGVSFNVFKEGVQEAYVDCDYGKEVVLFQNIDGFKCILKPGSGQLKSDRIQIGGQLTVTNINDVNKGIDVKDVYMPQFYIKGNGDVGLVNSTSVPYQVAGSYKGFKFVPYNIDLKKVVNKKYKITIDGMVVLADNLASNTKISNFSTTAEFDASKVKGGGPPPNQEVSFGSGEVYAGRKDATVDFGMNFKYYDGDNVYGKGFSAEGNYGIQQPNPMKVHAKMLIAKAPEGFNYWFFEAGQENVMQIPTGVLDLGIYGFTGRVYYKMKHLGTDITKDDYVPNKDMFIGIYGLTQLKTLTDNGIKFWGNVALEVATASWGLESIKFRGGGEFATQGVGTNGMIRAENCVLEFYWQPKEIYAEFNAVADFASAVTVQASAGFNVTKSDFSIWGFGTGYLFGSPTCSAADFGFECTDKQIKMAGNYKLIDIDKNYDLEVCEAGVVLKSKIYLFASVNYSPFQFQGAGTLSGNIAVHGCGLGTSWNIRLGAQAAFPNPTCVSAGIEVETPITDFTVSAGIKNGGIFFGSCF